MYIVFHFLQEEMTTQGCQSLSDEGISNDIYEISSDLDENTDLEESDESDADLFSEDEKTRNALVEEENTDEIDKVPLLIKDEDVATNLVDITADKKTRREISRKWRKKPEPAADTTFYPSNSKGSFDADTPMDAFFQFFDDTIVDKIVHETNLKSMQNNKPASITKEEMLVFFGINITMCFHELPSVAHYWSSHKLYGVEAIISAMSRDRYLTILKWLHVNDNSKIDKTDKLYKIRPLLDHLNRKFLEMNVLSENLAIDESILSLKGRSSLKHCNNMKSIKCGFKLWCLCNDSGYVYKTSVYKTSVNKTSVYNTSVYTGKEEASLNSELRKQVGLGGDVVLSLLSSLTSKNHKVFFKDFFSSLPLMEELKSNDILACGTISSNRKGFPENLASNKALKRGDFDYRSTADGITVYKWKYSKPVHLVSNYHGILETTIQRKERTRAIITVSCPDVVCDYNNHIRGVVTHDTLRRQYALKCKSKKLWHRLFFGLFDMALVNAYILFNKTFPNEKKTIADFRADVGLGLLTYANEKRSSHAVKRRKFQYSTPDSVRLSNVGIHKIQFTSIRGRCPVCAKNGIQSRPRSKCAHCNVHLCCNHSKDCFNLYHE